MAILTGLMASWLLLQNVLASESATGKSAPEKKTVQKGAEPPSGEFQLLISQGLNELDNNRSDQALQTFRQALRLKPDSADAYLQIGALHLKRGLLDVAKDQFEKAERYKKNFINPESELYLYFHMAALYHTLRYPDKEAERLEKLILTATNEAFEDSVVHRQAAGKAFFALALLEKTRGRSVDSRRAFAKAAQYEYRKKSSFLYLAHYYGSRTQDDVDAENRAWYKNRSTDGEAESLVYRKEHPGKTLKPENRNFLFETWFRRYEEAHSMDRDEETFL
ncbi:MAG: tetratricopeptide repeat protein, partial [Spirochaetia bacterium]|nr:tetratricopeptide repeat protein [Spirochaetia bacterium]